VANMLLSFNRKTKLDNSCNDEEEKNSEGENKGDKYDQFEANVNKCGHEWGEGNVCVYVGKMTEETLMQPMLQQKNVVYMILRGNWKKIQKPHSTSTIMNAT
jgi:hypothetical protein